jgi:hypothetical protein
VIDPAAVPRSPIRWDGAVRIIRSLYPPIDLFEDIADPADWPLLISAEQKTNPRLMESLGALVLVPPARRVGGPGSSWLMAPVTDVSADRPSRFSDGRDGVLYAGDRFEVALFETIHHHARFMARTAEEAGWTSQFREIVLAIEAELCDLRGADSALAAALDPADHAPAQVLGASLRAMGAEGVVYPSLRCPGGACAGLFYPDLAREARQGRHLDYHWDGTRVDLYRDAASGEVFRLLEAS